MKSIEELANDVLIALAELPEQKGYSDDLEIDIDDSTLVEVAKFIEQQGFARVGISKDNCFFDIKHKGRVHLDRLKSHSQEYKPIVLPATPLREENNNGIAYLFKKLVSAPPRAVWQIVTVVIGLLMLYLSFCRG